MAKRLLGMEFWFRAPKFFKKFSKMAKILKFSIFDVGPSNFRNTLILGFLLHINLKILVSGPQFCPLGPENSKIAKIDIFWAHMSKSVNFLIVNLSNEAKLWKLEYFRRSDYSFWANRDFTRIFRVTTPSEFRHYHIVHDPMVL